MFRFLVTELAGYHRPLPDMPTVTDADRRAHVLAVRGLREVQTDLRLLQADADVFRAERKDKA